MAEVGEVDDVADAGVAFHLGDFAEPGCGCWLLVAGCWWKQRQQRVEDFAEVADEGYVGMDVLVDLGGVDLDVDLLGAGRVAGEVAGDAVVEAHAEGEPQVPPRGGRVDA